MAQIDDLLAKVSQLLDRISALLGRRTLTQAEEAAWWAGTATGGPGGNGLYPRTDADGTVRLIPSPGAIAALAGEGGGGLDAAGIAALPAGTGADAGTDFRVLGIAQDGNPKRFPAPTIISRAIQDVTQINRLIGDEILYGWSKDRHQKLGEGSVSLTVGEILAGISGVLNPKQTDGAKGDGRVADDVVCAANSKTISSNTASFSALDVGKTIWLSGAGASYGQLATTITAVQDSKHVTLAVAASVYNNNMTAVWGTDDTAALQSWLDRLPGPDEYTYGVAGLIPPGVFLARDLKYGGNCAINGSGKGVTVLCCLPGGSGNAGFENKTNRAAAFTISSLTLLGNKKLVPNGKQGLRFVSVNGGDNTLPNLDPRPIFNDVEIKGFSGQLFVHANRGSGSSRFMELTDGGYYGLYSAGYDMEYNDLVAAACAFTPVYFSRFGAAGNTIRGGKSYFGGDYPYQQGAGGVTDPHSAGSIAWEDSCLLFLGGDTNIYGYRTQESWGPSIVVAGSGSFLDAIRIDDTGCVYPQHGLGRTPLLSVRAGILLVGASATGNVITNAYINSAVHPGTNWATNAVWFAPDGAGHFPNNNLVNVLIQPTLPAWYANQAFAPGQVGIDTGGSYAANKVFMNFAQVI